MQFPNIRLFRSQFYATQSVPPIYSSYVPDSFFAVRLEDGDGKTVVRTLQTLKDCG